MHLRYWGLIILLGLGWGSSMVFNEVLLRELGPLQVALGRVGFGALGCWLWVAVTRRRLRVTAGFLRDAAVFGVLQFAAPLTIFPMAQQVITSGEAGIINALTPVMVVIISHVWPGGERASVLKSLGVLCGFAGIMVLVLPALQGGVQGAFAGLLFCMLAPVCYGIAVNWFRRFHGVDATLITAWSLLAGTIALAPVALTLEGVPRVARAETWGALLIVGFVLTGAAFILLFWLLPRVGATRTSTITFIAPLSAVALGILFLNERLLPAHLIGMTTIFAGLMLIDGRLFDRWGRAPVA